MKELTAKNFAQDKANEIIQLCSDLENAENKDLRVYGIEKIQKLAYGILEHLEYLEIIKEEEREC